MKYNLNTSFRCYMINEGLVLDVADNEIKVIEDGIDELMFVLDLFKNEISFDEVYEKLNENYYVSKNDFTNVFEFLRINNIIKESKLHVNTSLNEYHFDKYDRQIKSLCSLTGVEYSVAVRMQEKLCSSKVILLGVGGVGSHLALALASVGVQNIVIADMDKIELSNTSRQVLYDETDVGELKIDVAAKKLRKYNNELLVKKYNKNIQCKEDLEFLDEHADADILLLCADTPRGEIQYIVDDYSKKSGIPWLFFGPYHHSKIALGPMIIPGVTKSYSDIFPKSIFNYDERVEQINNNFVASICDPFNAIAAQMAAIEVLKFITNYKPVMVCNKRYTLYTDDWKIEMSDL